LTVEPARAASRRRADAVAKLEAVHADTWVATASPSGAVHLVPLSFAWDGEHVLLAVQPDSPTVRNAVSTGRARLGFGPTRDVVLVDCVLVRVVDVHDPAANPVGARYADQADWDPRQESDPYVYLVLAPRRIQAWREANELEGRLLMRDGEWLV
jgi:hypothetical protein